MSKPKPRGTIDIMHERFLREALRRSGDHRVKAAKMLGVTERTVYHMMDKYDIPRKNKPKRS